MKKEELKTEICSSIARRLKTCGYEPFLLKEIDWRVLKAIELGVSENLDNLKGKKKSLEVRTEP